MTQPFKFLALGDSYTIGEGVSEADRWPVMLTESLRNLGIAADAPRIIAKTGWTTGELLEAVHAEAIDERFDLVSILIGVNDQYRGWEVEQFRNQFESLLDLAVEFAGGEHSRVVVLSIPDWGRTPFAKGRNRVDISREIDRFNLVKKASTIKREVDFVEVTETSRELADQPENIAVDGLHYSGKMHRIWADEVLKTKSDILLKNGLAR